MIARIASIFLFLYALILGAHFRGILHPDIRLFSLILLALVVGVWLLVRTRARWRWHATPLDIALPFWILAFVVSTLANPETARRSLLALWYMGVYIGLWYMLHDILANVAHTRRILTDTVLINGLVVLTFGLIEIPIAAETIRQGTFIYRFSSILGNPNTLGSFLVVLITITLGQALAARRTVTRSLLLIYAFLSAILLLLTFARSAWLGFGAGMLVGLVMVAAWQSWSIRSARLWWNQQNLSVQLLTGGVSLAGMVLVGAAALRFVASFANSARGLSYRPELFGVAGSMFQQNPLTGTGLFSFGRYQGQVMSLPPGAVHAHAHSLPVNIAGELGLVGLAALFMTGWVLARHIWGQWRRDDLERTSRIWLIAGTAATTGFVVTHLFDMPAMLPAVALTGLLAMILMTAQPTPRLPYTPLKFPQAPFALAGLWVVLFAAGLWDTQLYQQYNTILSSGIDSKDYANTASALQPVADADFTLPVYPLQQAYLWGLAAHDGDEDATTQAITAYETVITLEPYFVPPYANLSALYWQAGDTQQALAYAQQAAALAPESWPLQVHLGQYAESAGQDDLAREAYAQALRNEPDADLHPSWGQTPLQAESSNTLADRPALSQVVMLMESGDVDAALARWEEAIDPINPRHYVVRELLALAQDNPANAANWYTQAQNTYQDQSGPLWLLLGEARLARFNEDDATPLLQQAADMLAYNPLTPDYSEAANLSHLQYFRQVLARQFLPDVFYPTNEPLLLYLLATT
ncbi:MAG: hypothetical protein CL610_28990 [Anaerolineaceae bacterium]|nr:hypothetical protein [Anaerolineaceae bacterium]